MKHQNFYTENENAKICVHEAVNRVSGIILDNVFVIELMQGECEGKRQPFKAKSIGDGQKLGYVTNNPANQQLAKILGFEVIDTPEKAFEVWQYSKTFEF